MSRVKQCFMARVQKFLHTVVQHWSSNLYCVISDYSNEIVSIRKLGLCLKVVAARHQLPFCIRDFRPEIDTVDMCVVAHILILSDENKNSR